MKLYQREYPATENHKVIAEAGEGEDECYMIKIQHLLKPRGMNGEVIIAPAELPDLIKALTSAAIDATIHDSYLMGHADGTEEMIPVAVDAIERFKAKTQEK